MVSFDAPMQSQQLGWKRWNFDPGNRRNCLSIGVTSMDTKVVTSHCYDHYHHRHVTLVKSFVIFTITTTTTITIINNSWTTTTTPLMKSLTSLSPDEGAITQRVRGAVQAEVGVDGEHGIGPRAANLNTKHLRPTGRQRLDIIETWSTK